MIQKLFTSLAITGLLLSSQTINCSQKLEDKTVKKAQIVALIGTMILAITVHSDPFHVAQSSLPTNPVQHLNTTQTIDTECFGYSIATAGGSYLSNVYGPTFTHNAQNKMHAQDAIADIKKKYPDATIHHYDCRYFNHQPYTIQK